MQHLAAALLVILLSPVLPALRAQGSAEPRQFKPPRIAVVDSPAIYEGYAKKKDIVVRFKGEIETEEKKLKALDQKLKETNEEIKNVEEGGEKHKELFLRKTKLEYDMKTLQQEVLKAFNEKEMLAREQIRGEIAAEIERYAVAMELDLVLEKQILGPQDPKTGLPVIRFHLVHYVKPELDITQDIVKRLNETYGKPGTQVKKAK